MSSKMSLLAGRALDRACGEPITCLRSPQALLHELTCRQQEDAPDQWAILGSCSENRRSRATWQLASGLTLDLDWEDPTVPADEGAHHPIPPISRERILKSLDDYHVSGLAYLTPRGLRMMHVLAEDVTDEGTYEDLVDLAGEKLLQHLGECGVSLWRDGRTGLRFDRASRLPWQAMRLPLTGQPTLITGQDCEVSGTAFEQGHAQRMDLNAALPPELAEACDSIGAWAQIAPEVVVTGLMAISSAAIGNTRWIVARGRALPLSLHYLTSVASGSGKGSVREYLRRAAQDMVDDTIARREDARREQREYKEKLSEWRADGRSKAARAARGRQPEPLAVTGFGGERASFIVSEANLEGIIATLEDTPRGFLWASDEAHEVVGMLGRYGDSGGARSLDAARVRRLMDSAPVEAHRARSNSSPVRRLPRPWLAIDADVQPGVLDALFTGEDRVSGLTARLLIHAPPPMQGQRRYVDPPPEPGPHVLQLLRDRLGALWAHKQVLANGQPQYETVQLDPEAERLWAEELERLERRYPGASDEEIGALGHARGRLLRLAGVLALLRDPEAASASAPDMRRAIVHMRYHLEHQRALFSHAAEEVEAERLEKLRKQVAKLFAQQSGTGVRATDLRRHVSKRRYGGSVGLCRAYADLHALGWKLRRRAPTKGSPGRPPVPSFYPGAEDKYKPKTPTRTSHKPQEPRARDLGGLGDAWEGGNGHASLDPCELFDRASAHLLASGDVVLPRKGVRTICPACDSPDGLGVLPDEPTKWYCHSDRHDGPRNGCAVDYMLAAREGRMPTVSEAVREAKSILGGANESDDRGSFAPQAGDGPGARSDANRTTLFPDDGRAQTEH